MPLWGPWLGVCPTATASQSPWMQCLAQSHSGAGRKAPTNSSADAAARGGSARKPLCCCNVLLVALCTLKQIWQAGIVTLGSSSGVYSGCLISATAILHFSELALNAGPEVTIYCWFCWLRISLKANNGYKSDIPKVSHSQSVPPQGLGMLLLVVPITSQLRDKQEKNG